MSTTAPTAPAPAQQPVVVHDAPRGNTLGVVALGLAIFGFILAVFLLTAGLAWILLLPALALGVVGLVVRGRRRGAALAAVVIAAIGLILSFVGFRLPVGTFTGAEALNNEGVNPFSVLAGPLPGQQIPGVGGDTVAAGSNGSGITVEVSSVDCHQPLASVTGLNITGEVCAITLTATNDGAELVTIDSSDITANVDGTALLADVDLGEGPLLDAEVLPGGSTTGTVYVNIPEGNTGLDGLTVDVGGEGDLVDVDLSGLRLGG